MKKTLIYVFLIATFSLEAQTNSFPSSGNVGIGTTTPSGSLEVVGQTYIKNGRINFTTTFPNSGGITGIIADANGWSRLDPNGSRFIMPVKNADVSSKRNILDIENTEDGWKHLMELRADGSAFFMGKVGIGTGYMDAKLTVKGDIHANEVKVDLLGAVAPDYVFHKDYDLKSLEAVEDFIKIHGHLPNIPSAKDMEIEGIKLKEMNLKLLEKIEELTLYAIEQNKKLEEFKFIEQKLTIQEVISENLKDRLQKIETLLSSKQ